MILDSCALFRYSRGLKNLTFRLYEVIIYPFSNRKTLEKAVSECFLNAGVKRPSYTVCWCVIMCCTGSLAVKRCDKERLKEGVRSRDLSSVPQLVDH